MPLIKENKAATIKHDAIVLDLGDLRRQGEALRQAARDEADRILAAARDEATRLTSEAEQVGRQQGFEAGHAEGLEQGREEGRAEALAQRSEQLEQLQGAWVNAGQQWDEQRRGMVLDARQSLLSLALSVAEKIVKRVPQVDPSIVVDQISEAIEYVVRPGDVSVRIHPEDRSLVEQALPQFVQTCTVAEHINLIEDASISRGGCVVASQRGRIDATLDTQLGRIVDALLPSSEAPAAPSDDGLYDVVEGDQA